MLGRAAQPGVPGAGPVYRFAARIAFTLMDVQRWRLDVDGLEHVPERGGAVIATNHTSFWDFFTVGRPAYERMGRPVRILAKESLFRTPIFGWLMRQAEHIPVHRGSGQHALESAVAALRRGELVLVLPEQTISRSFELLPFKTGAARMAAEAGVPLVPAITWGTHRFHTAKQPLRWSWQLPVSVRYGPALRPQRDDDPVAVTQQLRHAMESLLHATQDSYPRPRVGQPDWWVPARLGGSAPTHEQALEELENFTRTWQDRAKERLHLDRRDAS